MVVASYPSLKSIKPQSQNNTKATLRLLTGLFYKFFVQQSSRFLQEKQALFFTKKRLTKTLRLSSRNPQLLKTKGVSKPLLMRIIIAFNHCKFIKLMVKLKSMSVAPAYYNCSLPWDSMHAALATATSRPATLELSMEVFLLISSFWPYLIQKPQQQQCCHYIHSFTIQ